MLNNVSLIILNYNSYKDTCKCVNQLISFNSQMHIIIVDNLSSDNSYINLKNKYKNQSIDVILSERNGGYSTGNNIGMKFAIKHYKSDVIGILNPDVLIPSVTVIKTMLNILMSNDKYAVVGGAIINEKGEFLVHKSAWNIPSKRDIVWKHFLLSRRKTKKPSLNMISDNIAQVDCVIGCFFLAKSNFMKEIGYLDENVFLYNEENILGIKVKKAGLCEVIATDQYYYHNHKKGDNTNMTFKKKINATHNSYLSRKYLCSKYYSKTLVPLLSIVELLNKIYLSLCYLKLVLKTSREE